MCGKNPKIALTIRVEEETLAGLRRVANSLGRTVSHVANEIIKSSLASGAPVKDDGVTVSFEELRHITSSMKSCLDAVREIVRK
jgi:hypothetical protein